MNSTSVGVVWFSELAKLASLRPLHRDSSEKVRCKVRLGDYKEKKRERSEREFVKYKQRLKPDTMHH